MSQQEQPAMTRGVRFARWLAAVLMIAYGFAKLTGSQFTVIDSEVTKPMGEGQRILADLVLTSDPPPSTAPSSPWSRSAAGCCWPGRGPPWSARWSCCRSWPTSSSWTSCSASAPFRRRSPC